MSRECILNHNSCFLQNVNGKDIKLSTYNYENKRACVEFIVEEVNIEKIKRKSLALCLLSIFNIIAFHFNLLHPIFFLFIFLIVSFAISELLLKVKSERLLIVKSLGIQISVCYYIGTRTTEFIPWDTVEKIFINEVITLQRVLFFLTIMKRDEKKMCSLTTLFKHMKPRLKCLEIIYKQMEEMFS